MSFSTLGLSSELTTPLARLVYATPTPVQREAIPQVLTGRDLLAKAQTGTGKTAAFGLPMIERLAAGGRRQSGRAPRGLVLVPTRELASQVHQSLVTYGGPLRVKVTAIIGGVSMNPQLQNLQRGTEILVATPGRGRCSTRSGSRPRSRRPGSLCRGSGRFSPQFGSIRVSSPRVVHLRRLKFLRRGDDGHHEAAARTLGPHQTRGIGIAHKRPSLP